MANNSDSDFRLEKRLKEMDPELHGRFRDTVFVMQQTLSKFKRLFPEYTDHSVFHSLNVLEFCNMLIGSEQMERLNKHEIYVLLMACYLHDSGMAISEKDYEEFKHDFDPDSFFEQRTECTVADFVRENHHEFSARFIRKYAELLEIPSEELLLAVIQVARGHRRTNLFDTEEYPSALETGDGCTVCTPYLAALIRLADEIDVVTDRNPKLLYDIESLTDEVEIAQNRMLEAVKSLDISDEGFLMNVQTDDGEVFAGLEKTAGKMQITLDLCRSVTEARTPFRITQHWVRIHRM